jgi:sulfatase maturation enzyme AslB (radical SAM superfamily)
MSVQQLSVPSSTMLCALVGGALAACRKNFPPLVRLETTNACNARCIICPHRDMRRPVVAMDHDLYTRLIDECAAAGCREVHLHNFGEPLLDKRIAERVAYAKAQGIRTTKIFCNGSLLSPERSTALIEAGLDEVKVSFDGATREEFERIRAPLKFDAVVHNIIELVKLRNAMRSPLKVYVACCSTTDKEATMQFLAERVDGFSFGKLHNWGGQGVVRKRVRKPCSRLWRTFTVLASGDVALCCLDYDGQELLGHVDQNHSIRDVWNGPRYREIRRAHCTARQGDIPLCANCTKAFL